MMIIVLDCNIWISLTINRQLDYIVRMAETGIKIASCSELRAEITDVLARPKLQKFVPPESIAKVAELHDLVSKPYKLTDIPEIVSDTKDNYLFALCAKSKANYLVSGDKIVLQVGIYNKTKLITLSELEAITSNV